jgi:hypothetical protein
MTEKEFKVIATMEQFGGSFIKALALCFLKADSINFEKLKKAFPEYWKEYKNFKNERY